MSERNYRCRLYSECLTIAATWDISLECDGCHMEHDLGGALYLNDFCFADVEACGRLIGVVFGLREVE